MRIKIKFGKKNFYTNFSSKSFRWLGRQNIQATERLTKHDRTWPSH